MLRATGATPSDTLPELEMISGWRTTRPICLNVAFSDLSPTPIFLLSASHHLQVRFLDIEAISIGRPNSVMRSLAGLGPRSSPPPQLLQRLLTGFVSDSRTISGWTPTQQTLATNVDLVKRVRALLDAVGRTIMSPIAAHRRLGLKAK